MFSRLSLLEKYYLRNPSYYKKEFIFTTIMPQKNKQKKRKVSSDGGGSDNGCKITEDNSGDGICCSLYTQQHHQFNDDNNGHNPECKITNVGVAIISERPILVNEELNDNGANDEGRNSKMLRNARLAIKILEDEEIEQDDEWEINNNSKSSDDFEDLFDLKRSTLMKSMKVEDVLEIISKIKGLDYTSNYPYLDDRRGLIMDLDDCFVKYCTIHGISIEYGLD
jgi:hypothetical protein